MCFMVSMKITISEPFGHMTVRLLGVLLCVGVFFGSSLRVQAFGGDTPLAWSVTDHLGKEVNSSKLGGKVTVVTFWATWCLPCLVEIKPLNDLVDKYQKNGLKVVGVSVDAQSNAMLNAFVDKFKMNYTVAMANPAIMNGFRVGDSVPLTFIIDQQGRIAFKHAGYLKKEELEKNIRTLLKL